MAAQALRARGEIDRAEAAFEALARSYRDDPPLHAVAVYNLGVIRYRRGDQQGALACFGVAVRVKGLADRNPLVADCVPFVIANCYTLLGSDDVGALWIAEGRRRRALDGWPMDVPAEALVVCRRHNYAPAVDLLTSRWHQLEGMLPAETVREIWIIRAFAQWSAEGRSDVRGLIPGIGDFDLGKYQYYGNNWPEFRQFLAELEDGEDLARQVDHRRSGVIAAVLPVARVRSHPRARCAPL